MPSSPLTSKLAWPSEGKGSGNFKKDIYKKSRLKSSDFFYVTVSSLRAFSL
jgi:hypothetical protein